MATMAVASARSRYSGGSRSSSSHSYSRPSRVTRTTTTSSTYHPPAYAPRPTVTKTTTVSRVSRPSTAPASRTTVTHVYSPNTYGSYYSQPHVVFAPTWGYSPTDGFGWSLYRDYSQPTVQMVHHHHHTSIFSLILASIIIFAIFCLFCIICYAVVNVEGQQETEEIIHVEEVYNKREDTAESQHLLKGGDEEDIVEEQVIYEYHPDGGVTEHRKQVVTKYEYTEHNDFPEEPAHAIAIGKPMPPQFNCNMPQMSTAGTSAMSYPQQQQMYGQPQVMNGPPQQMAQGAPVGMTSGMTMQPQQMQPQQQPYYGQNQAMYYNNGMN